jgi:hypothetical protein
VSEGNTGGTAGRIARPEYANFCVFRMSFLIL